MSWRYRYAWLSARDRAARHAAQLDHLANLADRRATRLHLAAVDRADLLEQLIAAGRTITELQAALDLEVKGHPS